MEDDSLQDAEMPPGVRNRLDACLVAGETALMRLAGCAGEGLALTDRRVVIVREQMHLVGGETPIDCFEYSYEQVVTAVVEPGEVSERFRLVLVAPPPDDAHVTLCFPPSVHDAFVDAAARVRLLCQQTRRDADVSQGPPSSGSPCPYCSAACEDGDAFCHACGSAVARSCSRCGAVVGAAARHCTCCGATAASARALACVLCEGPVAAWFSHCPACGAAQWVSCQSCGARLPGREAYCTHCGAPPADVTEGPPN